MADRRQRGGIGRLGPAALYQGPTRVVGAAQRGGPVVPPACPKCQARPPMWVIGDVSRCVACGATWFLTRHEFVLRRPKVVRIPVWLHPAKEATA